MKKKQFEALAAVIAENYQLAVDSGNVEGVAAVCAVVWSLIY